MELDELPELLREPWSRSRSSTRSRTRSRSSTRSRTRSNSPEEDMVIQVGQFGKPFFLQVVGQNGSNFDIRRKIDQVIIQVGKFGKTFLQVVGQNGRIVDMGRPIYRKVTKDRPLKYLMRVWSWHAQLEWEVVNLCHFFIIYSQAIRFHYDGRRITETDTPRMFNMRV